MQDVFVQPSGQDDNLGDSALRVGLIRALRGEGRRLHLLLEGQSSDYLSAMPRDHSATLYDSRTPWLDASKKVRGAVYAFNAGEIDPNPELPYPNATRLAEAKGVLGRGGVVIAAGIGFKDTVSASRVAFDGALRDAAVVSWRDEPTRDAAGFGGVAPDWGFALGSDPSTWAAAGDRPLIAVTLRFDRPWPEDHWLSAVRSLADRTGSRIVTVAQVARDAPRAVRLAASLGGDYIVAPTTGHDDVDAYVRSVYGRSLAVVSDRAHALIIGATEGAYPVGSASDPQKIRRLLDVVGLAALTGDHNGLADRAEGLDVALPALADGVRSGRESLAALTTRIRSAMGSVAVD